MDAMARVSLPLRGLEVLSTLGHGAFGEVLLCSKAEGGEEVRFALKVVEIFENEDWKYEEVKILKDLQLALDYVPRYCDHWIEKGIESELLFIQMEFCGKESLRQWLQTGRLRSESSNVFQIIKSCVQGLAYIHSRGYIHRDLKPENIVLSSVGNPKIVDFGTAAKLTESRSLTTGPGTCLYRAPEVLLGHDYSSSADIFSAGMIFYEMLLDMSRASEDTVDYYLTQSQTVKGFERSVQTIQESGNFYLSRTILEERRDVNLMGVFCLMQKMLAKQSGRISAEDCLNFESCNLLLLCRPAHCLKPDEMCQNMASHLYRWKNFAERVPEIPNWATKRLLSDMDARPTLRLRSNLLAGFDDELEKFGLLANSTIDDVLEKVRNGDAVHDLLVTRWCNEFELRKDYSSQERDALAASYVVKTIQLFARSDLNLGLLDSTESGIHFAVQIQEPETRLGCLEKLRESAKSAYWKGLMDSLLNFYRNESDMAPLANHMAIRSAETAEALSASLQRLYDDIRGLVEPHEIDECNELLRMALAKKKVTISPYRAVSYDFLYDLSTLRTNVNSLCKRFLDEDWFGLSYTTRIAGSKRRATGERKPRLVDKNDSTHGNPSVPGNPNSLARFYRQKYFLIYQATDEGSERNGYLEKLSADITATIARHPNECDVELKCLLGIINAKLNNGAAKKRCGESDDADLLMSAASNTAVLVM